MTPETFLRFAKKAKLKTGTYFLPRKHKTIMETFMYSSTMSRVSKAVSKKGSSDYQNDFIGYKVNKEARDGMRRLLRELNKWRTSQ